MSDGDIPGPGPRRRRGQVVVLIVILLLAMLYSLALLWLDVSPELTIAVLGAVAAVTVRLCRSLTSGPDRGRNPKTPEGR
ncbi:hypothetical protein [Actinoplanes sp. NPDC049118]|uniref:hypothetical protein n=1 Tax=Actinoplanes sp. NPDC049118 TaxID=3155769 RepID=UPI0033CF614B